MCLEVVDTVHGDMSGDCKPGFCWFMVETTSAAVSRSRAVCSDIDSGVQSQLLASNLKDLLSTWALVLLSPWGSPTKPCVLCLSGISLLSFFLILYSWFST